MRQLTLAKALFWTISLVISSQASAQPLVGKGEWESLAGPGIRGTWNVTLNRKSDRLTGKLELTGSNVFTGGDVSGQIDGSNVVLGVMVNSGKRAFFRGTLEGQSVKGEWDSALVEDQGVWYGTLIGE